ncbi:MAG: hypothetical protein IT428_28900 [Planctomycetaceae bacterium]|nr:hypothetical protein [Planctomycetaceae bacterium]
MTEPLTEIQKQLLRAAAIAGLGSQTDLSRANTVRVIRPVLQWRGLTEEQIADGWECESAVVHNEVYKILIDMVHDAIFFEGSGTWGDPRDSTRKACWPQYNSCRLTETGDALARELLDSQSPPGPESSPF